MKQWKWIIVLAFAWISCTRVLEEPVPDGVDTTPASVEGQKVHVNFSIVGANPVPKTKVLNNGGDIQDLYIAVFGSSGYLKEYLKANLGAVHYTEITVEKTISLANGGTSTIEVTHEVPVYDYSVDLTLSDSPRRIHFLGNGPGSLPFGYDTAVMPLQLSQLSESGIGEKAYWQMIDLPNGIRAKRNEAENFVDADGIEFGQPGFSGFVLDPDELPLFQEIPLIRNWAKIVLYAAEDSNFTPYSLAVINFPSRGAIAPYSAQTGFVRKYQNLGFEDLREMKYPANLPAGTLFDDSKPSVAEFQATSFTDGGRVAGASTKTQIDADDEDSGSAVYLYERPAPSENIPPTYVIIYGHYRNPDEGVDPADPSKFKNEGDYFYKVDLMETVATGSGEYESSYYPIYRNFKYQIQVKKILSMGHDTPEAAAVSAGSADVSADISTGQLSDISDGVGRLHITPWMAQTFIGEHGPTNPVDELRVYFSQDTDGAPDMTDNAVRVTLLPPSDGGPDIIYRVPTENPDEPEPFLGAPSTATGSVGWRPIRFCTVAPGKTIRSQTLRITGYHSLGRLYRDVVVSIQPIQPMWVKCENPILYAVTGTEQAITIGIPEGLTKAMFPLDLTIEAQDLTLSPDNTRSNNNLPVVHGTSISEDDGYAGKPTFQFVRNLSWEEYKNAPLDDTDEKLWRTVTCYFKTNCAANATKVWVYNKYFDLASTSFSNYDFRLIHSYYIDVCVPRKADVSIPFHFTVEPRGEGGEFPELTLAIRGMVNDREYNTGVLMTGTDLYSFTPTQAENELHFITTTDDGDISLTLSAPGYNTVVLKPYRFNKGAAPRSYGVLNGVQYPIPGSASFWSNVAYGRIQTVGWKDKTGDRGVIFGYFDDPDNPNSTTVTLSDAGGQVLKNSNNNSGLYPTTPSSYPATPAARSSDGASNYHELQLKTVKAYNNSNIVFQLSSPGYVTEEYTIKRLTGKTRLHSLEVTPSNLNNWSQINEETGVLSMTVGQNSDDGYFRMTITPLTEGAPAPKKSSAGITLGDGASTACRYQLTIESGDLGITVTPANASYNEYWKKQRFFFGQLHFDSGKMPQSLTPASGSGNCFLYPGSRNIYSWPAFDDEEQEYALPYVSLSTKSMVIETGAGRPVLLTRFLYKGISEYYN